MQIDRSKKLKILLGVHAFFPVSQAGTEVLTLELARGLRRRGHEVEILTGQREQNTFSERQAWITEDHYDGFIVHRLHYAIRHPTDYLRIHYSTPERVNLVKELTKKTGFDIVHFNHIMGFSGEVIKEVRLLGVPVIYTPTDFWSVCHKITLYREHEERVCDGPSDARSCLQCYRKMPKIAAILCLLLGRTKLKNISYRFAMVNSLEKRVALMTEFINFANAILPATRFLAAILERYGVSRSNIKVIQYGVDIGRLPEKVAIPLRADENNPLILGFIGSIIKTKGLHVILEALAREKFTNVVLNVYGKMDNGDAYSQEIMKKASNLGGKIYCKGTFPHERIGEILRGMHLLIVPAIWYESTPLVLCSALAAGTPVLVSRMGGMTEVIREGINGISFRAGDSQELSEIICNLLKKPEQLIKIQNNTDIWKRGTSDYAADIEGEYYSQCGSYVNLKRDERLL